MKYFSLLMLAALCACPYLHAQSIRNADGSPLRTQYCWSDSAYVLTGMPAGGTFQGCGISQQNGQWLFAPLQATANITVFPYQCNISYTVNNTTVSAAVLVWKPVVVAPALHDTSTCSGNILLQAATLYAGAYDYSWTPAAPLSDPLAPNTGGHISQDQQFVLHVTDLSSGCKGSDSLIVSKYPEPQITISPDTVLRPLSSIQLHAVGATAYAWTPAQWLDDPAIADPVARPEAPVTYTVTGTNIYGCSASASVHIGLYESLFVPNAFSPNGDGINDLFRIENAGYSRVLEFRVFNRWGQQVFFTMEGTEGWNGTYKGQPADAGNYSYYIRLRQEGYPEQVFRGTVLLIR